MKKFLPALAGSLLIVTIGMILVWIFELDLEIRSPRDTATKSIAPTLESPQEHSGSAGTLTRRPTLKESLPQGAKLIESTKIPGEIEVTLADGSNIFARGVSVTESGISFEGPYEFEGPNGAALTSKDIGSVFLLSRDGKSFKMFPAPGGTTSFSSPLKTEGK